MEIDDEDDDIPSTPTNSSPSSSDLDTQSTGSFFPDRSTTLGTLMGVTLNPVTSHTIRPPRPPPAQPAGAPANRRRPIRIIRRSRGRRSGGGGWWKLCRGDAAGPPPTKLGEFLEVERRVEVDDHVGFGFNGEVVVPREGELEGRLFENGRVLPPAVGKGNGEVVERRKRSGEVSALLVRFPVLITGICSGGERW